MTILVCQKEVNNYGRYSKVHDAPEKTNKINNLQKTIKLIIKRQDTINQSYMEEFAIPYRENLNDCMFNGN